MGVFSNLPDDAKKIDKNYIQKHVGKGHLPDSYFAELNGLPSFLPERGFYLASDLPERGFYLAGESDAQVKPPLGKSDGW